MHDRFEEGSSFNFNYNILLLVAAILAGLGLIGGSTATIIASMLVSPLMGPVIGMAYSTTINDWRLLRKSLRTEFISLLFCVLMGMIIGAISGHFDIAETWPNSEMISRGSVTNFWIGLPVAFFSGLGVAVTTDEYAV